VAAALQPVLAPPEGMLELQVVRDDHVLQLGEAGLGQGSPVLQVLHRLQEGALLVG